MIPDRFLVIFQKVAEAQPPKADGAVSIVTITNESSEIEKLTQEWSQCRVEEEDDQRAFWRS